MAESHQKKLDRVRAPKVQIKYDVETYGAIEKKELPFVVGVVADLSGDNPAMDNNGKPQKVKDRKFVNIDGDEFNNVLKASRPRVKCSVPDKLSGEEGKNISIDMEFESLDDFHPHNVAEKVEPIKKLVEARRRLSSLKQKMDGNDDLEGLVNQILSNSDVRNSIKGSVGTETTAGDEE